MSALPVMVEVRDALQRANVPSVAPPADTASDAAPEETVRERKRLASLAHIRKIFDRSTHAVLVVNIDKYGQRDYIGPNAFAEIAIAFAHGRRVYLYQGIPEQYADELTAWGVTPLHGDLSDVIASMLEDNGDVVDTRQLALFGS